MRRSFSFTAKDGRVITVRPSRARDARACIAIVAEAAAERPRTLALQENELWAPRVWRRNRVEWGPSGAWLVAVIDGTVVGQLTLDRGSRSVTRHSAGFGITVAASARGCGVGRALLSVVDTYARENGVTRLELGVFPDNERAIALYTSMGYTQEGIEYAAIRFPEGPTDVIKMSKRLDGRPAGQR